MEHPAPHYVRLLEETLEAIETPGDYCSYGTLEPQLPGLEVHGLGPISFPLLEAQAQQIKSLAQQAPFGRRTETLVDTRVRDTWQLEPNQFRLTNPRWASEFLPKLLVRIKEDFACEQSDISAELYKLLIYERNQHFVSHRDTEVRCDEDDKEVTLVET